jgi:cytochrome bd-type quinol oxidase subunit 2
MQRVTEYFALIAQVSATLLVAYVVLVGPRRNPDRVARLSELTGAAMMAFVLVWALASALPIADHSKDVVNSGWMLLAMIVSVFAMIFAAFIRPANAAKHFWFRQPEPIQTRLRSRRPGLAARPVRHRFRQRR